MYVCIYICIGLFEAKKEGCLYINQCLFGWLVVEFEVMSGLIGFFAAAASISVLVEIYEYFAKWNC
jgi:hypothetical protein